MTGLRIAIIAHALRAGGGISVGHNLIASMLRQGSRHAFWCVMPEGLGYEEVCQGSENVEAHYFRRQGGYWGRWQYDEIVLPRKIQQFRPDVVLCLGNRGLSYNNTPQAILCQDPHLFYPSVHFGRETPFMRALVAYNRWRMGRDLKNTSLLFCQTPVAAKRMKATYHYSGEIALAPNAVSYKVNEAVGDVPMPASLADCKATTRLFCLTRYYPHKNLEKIVEMFEKHDDELKDVAVILTISAQDHPNAGKLLQAISRGGFENRIINVGALPQQELAGYYRNCHALFLPTLLESFSGTYLEAMRFACPILTSDLDFARYVCGDAALYFDPWNTTAMKNAILRIRDTAVVNDLIQKSSLHQTQHFFSWDAVAQNVLEKLEAIVPNSETL